MALARFQNQGQNRRQSACRIRQNWRRKTIALGSGASQFESGNDDTQDMVHAATANEFEERRSFFHSAPPDAGSLSPSSGGMGGVGSGDEEAGYRTPSVVWRPRDTGSVQSRVSNFEALLKRSNSCDSKMGKVLHSPPPPVPLPSNGTHVEKSLFRTMVLRHVPPDISSDGPLKAVVGSPMPHKVGHLHRSWLTTSSKFNHRRSVPAAFVMAVDEPETSPGNTRPLWPSGHKDNEVPAPDSVTRRKKVFEDLLKQSHKSLPTPGYSLRKSKSDAGVLRLAKTPVKFEELTPMQAAESKVMVRGPCVVDHPVLRTKSSLQSLPDKDVNVTSSCSKTPVKSFLPGSILRNSLGRLKQMSEIFTLTDMNRKYPFVTKETTFEVTLTKSSRGFGIGICGGYESDTLDSSSDKDLLDALVRVKRLFPLQPALLSGKLEAGDVLLAVNGRPLTGLANFEAIDALRVAPSEVTLTICRPPPGTLPPVPLAGNLAASSSLLSLSSISLCGQMTEGDSFRPPPSPREFEMMLVKVGGSLGFTIHQKAEGQGHFVKSLVKDPALSDGRLQPGDLIVKVNGTNISGFSHLEAIAFLRNSPKEVDLLVRRGLETPLSPLSPLNQFHTFPHAKVDTKRKMLRKEARDLLSDKIARKNASETSRRAGWGSSPRARRKRLEDGRLPLQDQVESVCSSDDETRFKKNMFKKNGTSDMGNLSSSPMMSDAARTRLQRPSSLDLHVQKLSPLSYRANGREQLSMSPIPALCVTRYDSGERTTDTESSTTEAELKDAENQELEGRDLLSSSTDELYLTPPQSPLVSGVPNADLKMSPTKAAKELCTDEQHRRMIFKVELHRKQGSRLGFSLTTTDPNSDIYIKAILPGTLADNDGRIKVGDALLQVNGTSLSGKTTEDIVDLLRDARESVSLILSRDVVEHVGKQ